MVTPAPENPAVAPAEIAARARRLCSDPVGERAAAVPGAADVRQDGAALAWRHAGGVEHLHGVLPGHAAAGLRLRASGQPLADAESAGGRARRVAGAGAGRAADLAGGGRAARRQQPDPLAD